MNRRRVRRPVISSDEEEQPPVPSKKPRKPRSTRRPNNNERIDRLEQLLEKFVQQTSTSTPPEQSSNRATEALQEEYLQERAVSAGEVTNNNTNFTTVANISQLPPVVKNTLPTPTTSLIGDVTTCLHSTAVFSPQVSHPCTESVTPQQIDRSTLFQKSVGQVNDTRFISKPDNLPKFDGNSNTLSVHAWVHRLESLAKIYGWDEKTLIYHMTGNLEGNALLWFGHQQDIDISWEEWKKRLADYFPASRGLAARLHDLVTTNKRREEKVLDFYYKKLALGKSCELNDSMICDVIIYTLGDPLLKAGARGSGCRDTRSLLNYLIDAATDSLPVKTNDSFVRDPMRTKCYTCGRRGHFSTQCKDSLRCEVCNKIGHKTEDCRFSKKCSHCNKIGHNRDECYSLKNNSRPDTSGPKSNISVFHDDNRDKKNNKLFNIHPVDEGDRKYHKVAIANGTQLSAYIDLGSACNTITLSAANKINLVYKNRSNTSIKGYGGQIITPEGEALLQLCIDGVCVTTSVLIVKDNLQDTDMIVGRAFSELPGIHLMKTSDELKFSKSIDNDIINTELPFAGSNEAMLSKIEFRVPHDTLIVQGLNKIVVYTDNSDTDTIKVHHSEHRSFGKEIDIPEQITNMTGGLGYLYVYNLQCQPLTLYSASCIARGQIDKNPLNNFDTDLDNHNVKRLEEIIQKFSHCFDDDSRVGECEVVMKIELTTEVPFYYRPYRMSLKEQKIVRDIVQNLIDKDIIEPSNSPYASPVILIPKKSGDYRMCIDYRQLNKLTKKDRYPLPVIQDQLDRLSNEKWFTKLDLAAGFHQIKMHPDSRKYTAFVTPFGQFQYKRMPFGLANAPAVFQRAINLLLDKSRFEFATAYVDDILLFSNTIASGFEHLQSTLELISKSGLVLRREKCSFLKTRIEYLGHVISVGEIRPSPDKVEALLNFKNPADVHELRRFIGLASYFRKFVRSFANRIQPLSVLLKKDQPWSWGSEQQNSFLDIKTALSSEPVLAIYNPKYEIELHTDASSHGVGGILLQKQPRGELKPIAYFSKQTTATEQKYHSYELEAMAVVLSIRKFRVYLLGQRFTVVSDCQALSTTWTKKDLLPRIGRWWLELQSFDFTVQYRPGTRMQHVDALSRCALPLHHITEQNWIVAVQSEDPKIQNIINNIKSKDFKDLYKFDENILYRKVNDKFKIVVPKSVRWRVTKIFHDDNGHMCESKVIELIQRHYWFEKLRRFVTKYVKGCISCQFAKKPTGKQRGFLNPIIKGNVPWHTWHLDHLGPFCVSSNGNYYLLVIVDGFSKFTWLQPVPNTCAEHVVTAINFLVRLVGLPARVITDRGKAFTSQEFKNFCRSKQIQHILNAVSCPRANGQVERFNRTILQSLIAYTGEKDSDWEQMVPLVERGINTTINSTTQKCPYELVYGFKPRFDIDIPTIQTNLRNLPELRAQAQTNTVESSRKIKLRYDKNKLPSINYKIGDLVQVQRKIIKKGLTSGKLVDKYAGPYKIVKIYDNDRYRVMSLNTRGRKYNNVIAADKMKKFIVQTITDDESEEEN